MITPARVPFPSSHHRRQTSIATCHCSRPHCLPLRCILSVHKSHIDGCNPRIDRHGKLRTQCSVETHCSSKDLLSSFFTSFFTSFILLPPYFLSLLNTLPRGKFSDNVLPALDPMWPDPIRDSLGPYKPAKMDLGREKTEPSRLDRLRPGSKCRIGRGLLPLRGLE